MKRPRVFALPLLVTLILATTALPAAAKTLWQIGSPGKGTAQFALAPRDFIKYTDDPLFAVGISAPIRDWPYVQPGPGDAWAGSRPHAFAILFGLKEKPATGKCRLLLDFADTHSRMPPRLQIRLNGKVRGTFQTPAGGGDETVNGDLHKAKPYQLAVDIPAEDLVAGANEIVIETTTGSWVLYDAVQFEGTAEMALAPVQAATVITSARDVGVLVETAGRMEQIVSMNVRHLGPPAAASIEVNGRSALKLELKSGSQTVEVPVAAVAGPTPAELLLNTAEKTLATAQVTLKPVRKWTVYLLPHSHIDIGYTHVQDEVERRQWANTEQALDLIQRTASYPAGSRFKWNSEVMWAVDSYLRKATPEKQKRLIEAIRAGQVELDGLYGNELTGLCRPEELLRLFERGVTLGKQLGMPVHSAMISDVPGYTWGIVPAMAQAGIRYFSIGPNFGDRIGWTMTTWVDRPFWWQGPDEQSKVLCWVPYMGYALGHTGYRLDQRLPERLAELEAAKYPYDIVQLRWNVGGDNGAPDAGLADLVKAWNAKHAYPRMVIATVSELFGEFEKRYGDKLPVVRGDFTPYWEDGAASTAQETAINRAAAERLSQAEALTAILNPKGYPADDFSNAWRQVILYDEHTWGAHCSISEPDSPFTKKQWAVKQAFALDADKQSRLLLDSALGTTKKLPARTKTILVFNTTSWPRTDLVVVPKQEAPTGDVVKAVDGSAVPAQRLLNGDLAIMAKDVPAWGAKRFTIEGAATATLKAAAGDASDYTLRTATPPLVVTLSAKDGSITRLSRGQQGPNLADSKTAGRGLNEYLYVLGSNAAGAKRDGKVTVKPQETGPLVTSLVVESTPPGCRKLTREIRVVEGLDRVEILDTVDKEKVRQKEGVHFAFPFNVPGGVVRMDIPWAVARPEIDQMPAACKNWFTVQRWIDVSNPEYGVTWATVDAPLVEVGGITANLLGSQTNPAAWIKKLDPSQTLYSWVMNNHWHTNYKADQEGPTVFRYALRPHAGGYDGVQAARFGIEQSQPLLAVMAADDAPATMQSPITVASTDAIAATLKPTKDGRGYIVRLFGASGRPGKATVGASIHTGAKVWLSNLAEEPVAKLESTIDVPAYGLVTIRVELP